MYFYFLFYFKILYHLVLTCVLEFFFHFLYYYFFNVENLSKKLLAEDTVLYQCLFSSLVIVSLAMFGGTHR